MKTLCGAAAVSLEGRGGILSHVRVFGVLGLLTVCALALTPGCASEPKSVTKSYLTYFADQNDYAGFIRYGDANNKIFWNIGGVADSTYVTDHLIYKVMWSPAIRQLVYTGFDGIFTINPGDKTLVRLWHRDEFAIKIGAAVSPDGKFVMLRGFDSKKKSRFLAIVGLPDKTEAIHYVGDDTIVYSGMIFVDNSSAVVSLSSGQEIRCSLDAAKGWKFAQSPQLDKRVVIGTMRNNLVYELVGDKGVSVVCGQYMFNAPDRYTECYFTDRNAYALSHVSREIYVLTDDWKLKPIARVASDGIIGSGIAGGSFWVALKNGEVHLFNGQQHNSVKIEIPILAEWEK